jgi:hypothetical protein
LGKAKCRGIPELIIVKRFFLWFAGILVVLIAAVILTFKLSPWPSVAVISYMFSKADRASEAALEKHVPAGIVSRCDIAYGGAKDEVLDLYIRRERTRRGQPLSGCMAADSSPAARLGLQIT